MMVGVYNLFMPSEGVGIAYFLFLVNRILCGQHHDRLTAQSMGRELSGDYHQRSRVTAAREIYVLVGLMIAAAIPMIIEILADGGSGVGQVFKPWDDALGAFAGDFREKKIVDRATLTGPVLAGMAWAIIGILPICAAIVLLMVKEPPPNAGKLAEDQ